jgi:hypothetical protein
MRQLRRLLIQVAILVSQTAFFFISEALYTIAITGTILVTLPISWIVAVILAWTSHKAPDIKSLEGRADTMLTLAMAHTAVAIPCVLVLGRLAGLIEITVGQYVTIGLGYAVTLLVIPAIDWLRTWGNVWVPMIWGRRDEVEITKSSVILEETRGQSGRPDA